MKSENVTIFQIVKIIKNPEISKITSFPGFQVSRFPGFFFFFAHMRPWLDAQALRQNQRGGPLKSENVTIFQIVKIIKNPEISKITSFELFHYSIIPGFFSFSRTCARGWTPRPRQNQRGRGAFEIANFARAFLKMCALTT